MENQVRRHDQNCRKLKKFGRNYLPLVHWIDVHFPFAVSYFSQYNVWFTDATVSSCPDPDTTLDLDSGKKASYLFQKLLSKICFTSI